MEIAFDTKMAQCVIEITFFFLLVPVCPHAGGVGLCELVQHLSLFDYIAVSGSLDKRSQQ